LTASLFLRCSSIRNFSAAASSSVRFSHRVVRDVPIIVREGVRRPSHQVPGGQAIVDQVRGKQLSSCDVHRGISLHGCMLEGDPARDHQQPVDFLWRLLPVSAQPGKQVVRPIANDPRKATDPGIARALVASAIADDVIE
jgi:hypothetical protein